MCDLVDPVAVSLREVATRGRTRGLFTGLRETSAFYAAQQFDWCRPQLILNGKILRVDSTTRNQLRAIVRWQPVPPGTLESLRGYRSIFYFGTRRTNAVFERWDQETRSGRLKDVYMLTGKSDHAEPMAKPSPNW